MIIKIVRTTVKTTDTVTHAVGWLSGLWAIVAAIDLNAVQAWAAAITAVGAMAWGFWREQKRRDWENDERKAMVKAMVKANMDHIEGRREGPLPFPQVADVLLKEK